MCGKRAHNRFYEIYASYRSARTSFIGERSVADAQAGGQVENRFAGDGRCSREEKKKKGYSNLKIENRMPTHRTNIRIIEYSGPALVGTLCKCVCLL